jgi:hypothetical protein
VALDVEKVHRPRVVGPQDLDEPFRVTGKVEQVRRGIAEAGGQVAEGSTGVGEDVEGDPERSVTAGDDDRVVRRDPPGQPLGQLGRVARRGDVEVGVERGPRTGNGASDAIGARAAGPLVEEDGGARGPYGSASSSCVARSSDSPTIVNIAPSAK